MHTLPTARRAVRGYTILEVMVAMFVFVVAFTSVLALLPAGIWMQKQAYDDLGAQAAARSAAATIQGFKYRHSQLNFAIPDTTDLVDPIDPHNSNTNPPNSFGIVNFSRADRSYPSSYPCVYPNDQANGSEDRRTYYWAPLIRRTKPLIQMNAGDWQIIVLVMRRDRAQASPIAPGNGPQFRDLQPVTIGSSTFVGKSPFTTLTSSIVPGDLVVDSNGTVYKVASIGPNAFAATTITIVGAILPSKTDGKVPTRLWFWPAVSGLGGPGQLPNDGPPRVVRAVVISNGVQ